MLKLDLPNARRHGVKDMLVRIGSSKDVKAGKMRVFDVAGTNVNVASADGHLYAFDDTCTHTGCSLGCERYHTRTGYLAYCPALRRMGR
jgi:nitrite reductase/ring-hydroxylating ferredoxin subunit